MQALEKCVCKKTAVYELLKTGMVGRPAQVFTRYHEKDITRIRSHVYEEKLKIEKGKLKKGIIGYDTNALYLYCSGDVMPCSKDTLVVNKKLFDQKRIAKFSKVVLKGKVFRFAQVGIEVPDELCDKFGEMPPLFVVQEIPDRDIPEEMKIYKEKTGRKRGKEVLGCYEGKKDPFVHAPDWMVPTTWFKADSSSSIDWIQPGIPFSLFPEEVVNARRKADKDPLKKTEWSCQIKRE